jgi:hypothetical protein
LAWYEVGLGIPLDQAEKLIESVTAKKELWVKRTSKETVKDVDIRRHVLKLKCQPCEDQVLLKMDLALGSEGYARPEEILVHGFGFEEKDAAGLLIKRTGLFVRRDGQRLTPMEVL